MMQTLFSQMRSTLNGIRPKPHTLLDYADLSLCEDYIQQHARSGITAVPIARIKGSLNRTNDFDADFNPLTTHTYQRLKGIRERMRAGRSLPPVELVQINEIFYVRDGHHRIAAARSLGQDFIDALIVLHKVENE
jgi:hypothetical protein